MNPSKPPSDDRSDGSRPVVKMGAIPKKSRPSASANDRTSDSKGGPPSLSASIPRRQSVPSSSLGMSLNQPIPRARAGMPIPRKNSSSTVKSFNRTSHASKTNSASGQIKERHKQRDPHRDYSGPPSLKKRKKLSSNVISEYPFLVKIPLMGIPMDEGLPPTRLPARNPERGRPTYEEVAETDSDDLLTDSSNDDDDKARNRRRSKKLRKMKRLNISNTDSAPSKPSSLSKTTNDHESKAVVDTEEPSRSGAPSSRSAGVALVDPSLDVPPPGTLNTLWYSRECFIHMFVMEKPLAWKTRVAMELEWIPENFPSDHFNPPTPFPAIDAAEAQKLQQIAIANPKIWNSLTTRMEISRLHPEKCPVVILLACAKELNDTKGVPKFRIRPIVDKQDPKYREEVYLVKWRGRSHIHVSWERGSDLIKFDQSNNTARHKLRRFAQAQEIALGLDWKKVLEGERSTAATIHAHGTDQETEGAKQNVKDDAINVSSEVIVESDRVEEHFAPANLEVERILGCDESEMDPKIFAKQRAANAKAEQHELELKEGISADNKNAMSKRWNSQESLQEINKGLPWDPEDNVRYIVKWKSLPYSEITWEYWRDIKRDATDEAEDFWIRQQPPETEIIEAATNRNHPHIREFRKIKESPAFGISERIRETLQEDSTDSPVVAADTAASEKEEGEAFRLRSYQLEGVNWLLFNWWNRRSCILADEMGLGKTIQSLCFLKQLQDNPVSRLRGPFLVVAPLSLIGQWKSEAKSWVPDLNVFLYHGSADARDFLVQQEFYYSDQFIAKERAAKLKKQHITKFHILITTYEVVLKDINVLSKIRWRALIVDEAHRLKNSNSRLFQELTAVPRDYCILLTGTPLANATEELWALLHFADPIAFKSKDSFLEKFGELKDAEQVNELHSLLKPYLLRRVKEDVEKSLPPKEETILEVALTPIQKKYYKAIYERNTAFLYKGSKPSNAPSLMNVMMELRKCCNHPYLVRGAEERILADAASAIKESQNGEGDPPPTFDYVNLFGEQLVKSSGKMVLIAKLLPKLFKNGHKVLIFSQMVRVLDLLEELLKIMKYRYERLDGSTSSSSRASAVDRFVRESCKRFVMLLSTRAGGLGLNLTAADIVIIFDSDWNPQNDLQAMARAHRIGQTKAVRVYRLLTAKTYEMHMFHSASMKLGLERAVLSQSREQNEDREDSKTKPKSDREAQAKEIDELLKKGAYDVFRDEDDKEAEKFMESDIDQLLERSSKQIVYGAQDSSGGLGSFSKASFVADTGDGEKDVDLDDPDFWSKTVGLDAPVETPEDIAQMLDDGVKRSRKQVQQFDPYAEYAEAEQRKLDKIAFIKQQEKDEKDRLRLEQRKKKRDAKEKRKREREDSHDVTVIKNKVVLEEPSAVPQEPQPKKKPVKEPKLKKPKKSFDRKRMLKKARNEDPVLERLKQGWEIPQFNRVAAAIMRFGFYRFCKVRHESNLASVPIQDIEVFARSYFHQVALQVGVSILSKLQQNNMQTIENLLIQTIGNPQANEVRWVMDAVLTAMKAFMAVESGRKSWRLPVVLADPTLQTALRTGDGIRIMRRCFIMCRIHQVVESSLDEILGGFGYEELGKRGCAISDLSSLDADLKCRLVTTEELSLVLSSRLNKTFDDRVPVAWWDRSCDIGLLVGTFVHGFGNYDIMMQDDNLPFKAKAESLIQNDLACYQAQQNFGIAATSVRKVFENALESAKAKAQEEIHAAVAAAAAASSKREKDAVALREGGSAATTILNSMNDTPSEKTSGAKKGHSDSDYITLQRLKTSAIKSIHETSAHNSNRDANAQLEGKMPCDGDTSDSKSESKQDMSIPDGRILDLRLSIVVNATEKSEGYDDFFDKMEKTENLKDSKKSDVVVNIQTKHQALKELFGTESRSLQSPNHEYGGVGFAGSQCGTCHRSLTDGTDFANGAASPELYQVASGSDAPKYLRGVGVPMNVTRYAIGALVHTDFQNIEHFTNKQGTASEARVLSSNEKPSMGNDADEELGNAEPKAVISDGKQDHLMQEAFAQNAPLRANICIVALHFGIPSRVKHDSDLLKSAWAYLQEQSGIHEEDSKPFEFFSKEDFRQRVVEKTADSTIPDADSIMSYIDSILLQRCLSLCLTGNGDRTLQGRGSNGAYETGMGTNFYPEAGSSSQSPLPDPCLPLHAHSIEAVAAAFALLRRARMMKSLQNVMSGALPLDKINEILESPILCRSMEGLPEWWSPRVHDVALMMYANSRGLFSVVIDRMVDAECGVFGRKRIADHIYSSFVVDENKLPSLITDASPLEDVSTWIGIHADRFPTPNAIERRLAFICAQASKVLGEIADEVNYTNIPMFDHGGWPRN